MTSKLVFSGCLYKRLKEKDNTITTIIPQSGVKVFGYDYSKIESGVVILTIISSNEGIAVLIL